MEGKALTIKILFNGEIKTLQCNGNMTIREIIMLYRNNFLGPSYNLNCFSLFIDNVKCEENSTLNSYLKYKIPQYFLLIYDINTNININNNMNMMNNFMNNNRMNYPIDMNNMNNNYNLNMMNMMNNLNNMNNMMNNMNPMMNNMMNNMNPMMSNIISMMNMMNNMYTKKNNKPPKELIPRTDKGSVADYIHNNKYLEMEINIKFLKFLKIFFRYQIIQNYLDY